MKTKIREYYEKQKEIPHIRRYDIVPIVNYAFRRYVIVVVVVVVVFLSFP